MTKPKPEGEKADRRRKGSAEFLGPNSEIGRKLKQYYDGLVSEEIPDRFAQLLRQLEQTEPAQKKG
ncbi:MAG: NepR family anti-sigma factor [Pseudaminobacter sp.]